MPRGPLTLGMLGLVLALLLAPLIARAIEPSSRPALAPTSSEVSGEFTVTPDDGSRAIVEPVADATEGRWSLWKWPVAALLTMTVALVCSLQYQALQKLRRRSPRHSKPHKRAESQLRAGEPPARFDYSTVPDSW